MHYMMYPENDKSSYKKTDNWFLFWFYVIMWNLVESFLWVWEKRFPRRLITLAYKNEEDRKALIELFEIMNKKEEK